MELKRTALNAIHRAAGAKMVEFGGWEMPVEYSGIMQEHVAVRTRAGLFDVSHMGEIEIRGPRALDLVQHVTSNDAAKLRVNRAQYTALMYPQGSAVDDCLLHKFADDYYFLCVNAANTAKDFDWIVRHNSLPADVRDASGDYSQLALQGPRAAHILAKVTTFTPEVAAGLSPEIDGGVKPPLEAIKYYGFARATCCGVEGLLARTGYTGEDGFEFYFPPPESQRVWSGLLEAGKEDGLIPAGLGARNTLRLEAAFPLYGHELDDETTLLEAGLGWISKLDKGDFLGREALAAQKQFGVRKQLVGFEMCDRGIARDGYPVAIGGERVGKVTSGSYAPFLRKNIGLAYLPPEKVNEGSAQGIEIEIRGRAVLARLVPLPFYKRQK